MIAEPVHLRRVTRASLAAAAAGAVALVVGAVIDPRQFFVSYLVAYAYAVSIALGALLFLMIVHAMRAGWPVVVRRLTEAVAGTLPLLALLFVPLLFGLRSLYPWLRPETVTGEAERLLLAHKAPYLNLPFFLARAAVYLGVWVGSSVLLRRWSLARDRDPTAEVNDKLTAFSAAALPAVALSLSFAAFDWLMSLTPTWSSTMYPVYYFAGGFLGAIAALTLAAFAAQRAGLLPQLSDSHWYALGRLLLSFVIFWAYAGFFQLLLIWIADKPAEVGFYADRVRGPWAVVTVLLGLGHFALPFLLLLSYRLKRRGDVLAALSAWLLLAHYADIQWLVEPAVRPAGSPYHWLDAAALLAVGGASVAWAARLLRGRPILPVNDPGLPAAVRYESL